MSAPTRRTASSSTSSSSSLSSNTLTRTQLLLIGGACTFISLTAYATYRVRRSPLYRAWKEGWRRYNAMTPEEREATLAELRGEKRCTPVPKSSPQQQSNEASLHSHSPPPPTTDTSSITTAASTLADDDYDRAVATARILSASEQLNIHLALRESLQKIFDSVDEDGDGVITREEMGSFLKKLGLTGDRELAFLNIVGEDEIQTGTNGKPTGEVKSPNPATNGTSSSSSSSTTTSSTSSRFGINFKQFFDRFQDTLEGMDEQEEQRNQQQEDDAAGADAASAAAANANADLDSTPVSPLPTDSLHPSLFTPQRPSSTSASSTRLTVDTTPNAGGVTSPASGSLATPRSPSHPSSSVAASASPAIRVFLGGACGDTTWRKLEAIPQLQAAGITFYDPQVKEWSPKLVALEGLMKAWCRILFFVIGSRTRALASQIEVASLIAAGRRVVLVIEPIEAGVEIEGQIPSASEVRDINRAREYLRDVASHYACPVYPTTDAGIKAIIQMEEEEKKEMRLRMQAFRESRGSISGASLAAPPAGQRRQRGSILIQANGANGNGVVPNGVGGGLLGASGTSSPHPRDALTPSHRRAPSVGSLTTTAAGMPPTAPHLLHSHSHSFSVQHHSSSTAAAIHTASPLAHHIRQSSGPVAPISTTTSPAREQPNTTAAATNTSETATAAEATTTAATSTTPSTSTSASNSATSSTVTSPVPNSHAAKPPQQPRHSSEKKSKKQKQ